MDIANTKVNDTGIPKLVYEHIPTGVDQETDGETNTYEDVTSYTLLLM
jgi:hypothetical protein